jgi:hypothetical protein
VEKAYWVHSQVNSERRKCTGYTVVGTRSEEEVYRVHCEQAVRVGAGRAGGGGVPGTLRASSQSRSRTIRRRRCTGYTASKQSE